MSARFLGEAVVETWIKRFVAIIAIAILMAFSLWRYLTWRSQREAEHFISDMRSLEIGKSTAADLSNLIKSTSQLANGESICSTSGNGDCMGRVTFTNFFPFHWRYSLHFTAPMAFRCWLYTISDRLQSSTCYMTPVRLGYMNAFVEDGDGEPSACTPALNPQNKYFKIKEIPVGLLGACINAQTPLELRDLAYKFDFNCFSRLCGCRTFEGMLPILSRKDLY
jgi:hypothetical protein